MKGGDYMKYSPKGGENMMLAEFLIKEVRAETIKDIIIMLQDLEKQYPATTIEDIVKILKIYEALKEV